MHFFGGNATCSGTIKSPGIGKKIGIVIGSASEGQPHRHLDIAHHAHGDGDRGDTEVAGNEVAIGYPRSIAPR